MTNAVIMQTIPGSRRMALKTAATGLVFVALGVIVLATNGPLFVGIMPILLFGLLCLVPLWRIVLPGQLLIDPEGFAWSGFPRSWRVQWTEVAGFRLVSKRRSSRILIDYKDPIDAKERRHRAPPRAIPGMLVITSSSIFDVLQGEIRTRTRAVEPILPVESGAVAIEPKRVFPWLSLSLACCLILVFGAELSFPIAAGSRDLIPSIATLIGFGGSNWLLVVAHSEWYRIVTAPFLHGSVPHLMLNCVALLLAGWLLEGLVGRAWFVAIYTIGAWAGGFMSLVLNQSNIVSVGASGAIMALFAAIFVCSLHFPRTFARDRLQQRAVGVLLPTLLAFGQAKGATTIDFGAHLGGAIGGASIGGIVLLLWKNKLGFPPKRKLALSIASVGGLLLLAALWPAAEGYTRSALLGKAAHVRTLART